MRKTTGTAIAAVCSALLIAPPALAAGNLSYHDNKMNFKACDGERFTARWDDFEFGIGQPGKAEDVQQETLKYLGWDGTCQTVKWDKDTGKFVHENDGKPQSNRIVSYVAWDGGKWAATREGTGFYHVRLTREGDVTSDRIGDVVRWLTVHKSDDQGAAILARELKETATR